MILTSTQGAKSFLCVLINSLSRGWLPAVRRPLGPHPLTLQALSPREVSLTGGLGPRQGSCSPPLSLLAQSFLSGMMACASPGSLSAQRPLKPWRRASRRGSRARPQALLNPARTFGSVPLGAAKGPSSSRERQTPGRWARYGSGLTGGMGAAAGDTEGRAPGGLHRSSCPAER